MFSLFGASTVHIVGQRVASTWPWYVVRGAGFTAVALLILLVISGIGQVTGFTYHVFEPVKAWAIHRALALALCVAILVHATFLLIDHFVPFSLTQVLVPFAATYKRSHLFGIAVGSLSVALGIFAAYGIAITVLTSLGWINTKKRLWKQIHYWNYLIVVFVFFHALYTGSDLSYGTFRTTWIAIGIGLGLLILMRLWRAGTLKTPREEQKSS